MDHRSKFFLVLLLGAVLGSLSCGASANPYIGRVLTSITVTPGTADAQNFPNGQVIFTATGIFSLPPTPAPVTFTSPYTGQFSVSNPATSTIATVVSSGSGTITVACASGASGTVDIVANAAANNGTTTTVAGIAKLTCP